MDPQYLPIGKRTPDSQYQNCLRQIRGTGEYIKHPDQTEGRYTCLTLPAMNFYFSNGFPVLTERRIGFWKKPIQELFAFINGVRDARVLADEWGVDWWKTSWAYPEKCAIFGLEPYDLGPGSYGPALHDFPNFEQNAEGMWLPKPFNQFEHLIKQIKYKPDMATHRITSWIPQYCLQHEGLQRKVVVAPCHADIQVTIINGKLIYRMDQRSADFLLGVPSNMIQHAAATLGLAHITGYEPYLYIHACHDAQIYERHRANADEILERKPMKLSSLYLTEEGKQITNFFEFRAKHFELQDYESHPAMKLEGAVE